MKRLVMAVLAFATLATTSLASVANASGPIVPPTPVQGMAYVVDGESQMLWAIPPGGGSPIAVADLSAPATGSSCGNPYPWGATVVGEYVYWMDDDCGSLWRTSVITGVSTDVIANGYLGFSGYGYVTSDAAGNVWTTSSNSVVVEIPAGTQTPVFYSTTGGSFGGFTGVAATQGYIYLEAGSSIYRFVDPASGSPSNPIALQTYVTNSPGSVEGFAADPSGNLYVSSYDQVYKIDAGTQASTLLPQSCTNTGIENITYDSGSLYFSSWNPGYVCRFDSSMTSASVYAVGANPTADPGFNPEGFGFFDSVGLAKPQNLGVTSSNALFGGSLSQMLAASWAPVPGATGYLCTLMYGFNTPTSFTTTSTTTSCYFQGLDLKTEYGISVAATNGGAIGPSAVAFAAPTPVPPSSKVHRIVCQKNYSQRKRVITRVNPRCPSGWHRVA